MHSHPHPHTTFVHFRGCPKRTLPILGSCYCEGITYAWLLTLTILGFLAQYAIADLANSASVRADAWHTLFDGADIMIASVVLIVVKRWYWNEDRTRGNGALVAFILLTFAIASVAWVGVEKIAHGAGANPELTIVGGCLGVLIGKIATHLTGRTPPSARSINHELVHGHVHTDYLISWGVALSGALQFFPGTAIVDGLFGIFLAAYLAYEFLPRYYRVLRDK